MELRELLAQNPWWQESFSFENDTHLKKLSNHTLIRNRSLSPQEPGIYIVRGPRQIGKTTDFKRLINSLAQIHDPKNILFYNCELLSSTQLKDLIETYVSFQKSAKYILLDEISSVKDWQKILKFLADRGDLDEKIVVVTGSNSLDMKFSYERLPGRMGKGRRLHHLPMSFYEFITLVNPKIVKGNYFDLYSKIDELNKLLFDFSLCGGVPLATNNYYQKGIIENSTYTIYRDWIIGDIEKWNLNTTYAREVLEKIVSSMSSRLSWSTIAEDTSFKSHHTTFNYIDIFERIFLLMYLFNVNSRPLYAKNKKLYPIDPFFYWVIAYLLYEEQDLFERAQKEMSNDYYFSKSAEMIVAGDLLKHSVKKNMSYNYRTHLFYYATKSKEIDFCLKTPFENQYCEVKWSSKIKEHSTEKVCYLTKNTLNEKCIPIAMYLILLGRDGEIPAMPLPLTN